MAEKPTETTGLLSNSASHWNTRVENPYKDEPKHMTWGRRIARSLSKYKWYYPNRDVRAEYEKNLAKTDEEKTRALDFVEVVPPSLDMAWSYFEHITLP
eukprot:8541123-Ditylum_brightwellii.AAC.1